VDEARTVLARLERIDALERRLLDELEALAPEAERWARAEQDEGARRLAASLEHALERISPRPERALRGSRSAVDPA
jgi:hypothetical protein